LSTDPYVEPETGVLVADGRLADALDRAVIGTLSGTTCLRGEPTMTAITATDARKRLFPLLEQVNDDHVPVEIVHRAGNAVLVAKDDWDAMVETAYLSRGENGRLLREAITRLDSGAGVERDLIDE
jgi:antitoxin YefM